MNFVPWNIVRKDFRLTRFYLVAWWGILIAGLYNIHWCLNKIISDPNVLGKNIYGDYVDMLTNNFAFSLPFYLFWVFVALGIFVLMALVDSIIKADSPIDVCAEWRTRPVSGLGVWRAKVFYCGAFLFLGPGAIFLLFYLLRGGWLADAGLILTQWGLAAACIIAAVATAAVLYQRTFTGLLVLAAIALGFFMLDLADLINEDTFNALILSFRQGWISAWEAMGIFVITGLAVSAMSYDGRRRTPCRVVLGGGVLAALLALWAGPQRPFGETPQPQIWMGNYTSFRSNLVPRQPDPRLTMTLFQPSKHTPISSYSHQASPTAPRIVYEDLSVQVSYQGLPSEVCLSDSFSERLTFSNDTPIPPNVLFPVTYSGGFGLFNLAPAVAAAGYGTLLELNLPGITPIELGKKEDLDQLGPTTLTLEGRLTGKIGHLEVISDEPLQGEVGLEMVKIETSHPYNIESSNNFVRNRLGDINITRWEVQAGSLHRLIPPLHLDFLTQFALLYNPLKHEAVRGTFYQEGFNETFSIYSLRLGRGFFDLTPVLGKNAYPQRYASLQAAKDWIASHQEQYQKTMDDWLVGARLVELRFVPDRAIENTVTLDAIPLNAPAPAPAASTSTP